MKLKSTVVQSVKIEFDTDSFTAEQWREFIIKHVPANYIVRTMKNDLFPLDALKEKAIQCYQLSQQEIDWL